jgi:hypothetical protein
MNDFSNVKNNMGVKVEYYYLLQPKNWKIGIFMVSIIKKKLTKFCSNLKKKKPNQISSQNMLSNEFYFFKC